MQNGFYIDEISTPNVKIKQLYIKWNEKIDVSVEDVKISASGKSDSKFDLDKINHFFNEATLFRNWIERATIKNISFNDVRGSFNFDETNGGFLQASSDEFSLKSSLNFQSGLLVVKIDELKYFKRNVSVKGNVVIDDALNLTLDLQTDINGEIVLLVNAFADRNKFLYSVKSDRSLKNLKGLMDSVGLPKGVRYWVIDAIDAKRITLNEAHGWIDYNDVDNAYKNIYARATLKKLNYTYDKKLDAIHTQKTDIEFKDGVLFIYPRKAFSYKQNLGKSWLKIDFTTEQATLTLHLLFDGVLNRDMLGILDHYKVKLPFLQKKGSVSTKLKLVVNLLTVEIDAQGEFFVKEGNFDYLGLNLDVQDANIVLNNNDVSVDDMMAQYGEIASAKVDFRYNAKKSIGKIDFDVTSVKFKDVNLSLANESLKVTYMISPNRDRIYVAKSNWKLFDHKIQVDKLTLPFNIDSLIVDVPKTAIMIDEIAQMQAQGIVDINDLSANLDADLTKLEYKNVSLSQSSAKVKFIYNKNLKINLPETVSLLLNKKKFTLSDTAFSLKNSEASVTATVDVDNLGSADATLKYNVKRDKGVASLSKIDIKNESLGSLFNRRKSLNFYINRTEDVLKIDSDEMNVHFISTNGVWVINVNSIDKIARHSKALKKFKITNGKFILNKLSESKNISYSLSTLYPYKVIVIDDVPLAELKVHGKIDTLSGKLVASVNKFINVEIDEKINVSAKNVGVDVEQLLKALDNNDSDNKKSSLEISLNAKNCFLYVSESRRAISDEINLQYSNNKLIANLKHKDGNAGFSFHENNFQLYGENFNNKFMESLFSLSKFKGGKLSFSMNGTPQEYQGVFNIDNTVIKSYKVLNNILAFVNTIPSLVTFSLPGYHKHGLKVKNAYMNFTAFNDDLKISNVYLDSKELKILGNGKVNFDENRVDMKLNLKTDLASTVSKVPVVGHILFDDESISTSLSIKGKLSDPKVKSLIAKEIIVAPLNIIKRTLLYPYHLLSKIKIEGIEEVEVEVDISEEDE